MKFKWQKNDTDSYYCEFNSMRLYCYKIQGEKLFRGSISSPMQRHIQCSKHYRYSTKKAKEDAENMAIEFLIDTYIACQTELKSLGVNVENL